MSERENLGKLRCILVAVVLTVDHLLSCIVLLLPVVEIVDVVEQMMRDPHLMANQYLCTLHTLETELRHHTDELRWL